MEAQLQFPDLDAIFTLSRVEVVSNLEVEAVKGALRWVFQELQKQQTASRSFDPSAMHNQIQELVAARDEQKATAQALQNQQEQLLQRAEKSSQEIQALQEASGVSQAVQSLQGSNTGASEQLAKLQQQLDNLADSQASLARDVAALKQTPPPVPAAFPNSSSAAPNASASSSQSALPASTSTAADNQTDATAEGSTGRQVEVVSATAGGSNARQAEVTNGTGRNLEAVTSHEDRLKALIDEVANLKRGMQAVGRQIDAVPAAVGAAASVPNQAGAAPSIPAQQNRLVEQAESRLEEMGDAVAAVQQQLAGQAGAVADLANASAELRRLLADKAGLADVQAVLKAQSAPTTLPVTAGGSVDMSAVAGAVNGLGGKLASLEALLALSQQRIADKADTSQLDHLRAAMKQLKAAVGDDTVPLTSAGATGAGPDVVPADVVPADVVRAETVGLSSSGPSVVGQFATLPGNPPAGRGAPGSISARLALLERSPPIRAGQSSSALRTGFAGPAALPSSSHTAASTAPDSDLTGRLAALESEVSQLKHSSAPQIASSAAGSSAAGSSAAGNSGADTPAPGNSAAVNSAAGSLALSNPAPPKSPSLNSAWVEQLSSTAGNSAQAMQTNAALLSSMQSEIEQLRSSKADKADLDALQLRAAIMPAASSSGSGKPGDTGNLASLLETVQKMIGGKADKEEVQGLKKMLADKVNLADHQVDINNVQHSISLIHFQSGSGPAPPAGAPSRGVPGGTRAAGGFVPVRPARRSRMGHEENQVPEGELWALREELQQLKHIVEVLTDATHLMAIPNPSKPSSPPTAAASSDLSGNSADITAANPGAASSGNSTAAGPTAAASDPTAALGGITAAAGSAAATAAIAGLIPGAGSPGGLKGKAGGGAHLLTGLTNQKQAEATAGQRASAAEAGASAATAPRAGPGAPAVTPRAGADPSALLAGAVATPQEPLEGARGARGSGPLQELVTHMQAGQLGHKMNDSDIHDQLAHRLAAVERLVRKLTQQLAGGAGGSHAQAGSPGGTKDRPDERLLRRLGSDLALLKKRVDELAPAKDAGALMMLREGEHAMLAAKPLQGYRCMACDRPLAKLDPDMGGFIPAPPMTVSVAMDISKNNGMIPSKEAGGKSPGKKGSLVPQHSRTSIFPGPPHTGEDPVGPQNWFKDAHGQPAEALPREDVGPHLPPGGTGRMAEEEELAAWESQATIPLPDIHAKSRA